MMHPQAAVGGNGLWMWRVVVKILNKHVCRQLIRGGPPALGLGKGLTTSHYKNPVP